MTTSYDRFLSATTCLLLCLLNQKTLMDNESDELPISYAIKFV